MIELRFAACSLALMALSHPLYAFECKFDSDGQKHSCLIELSTLQVKLKVRANVPPDKNPPDREISYEAKGSGFVVDGRRNLLITAKHIFLGDRIWPPDVEGTKMGNFTDLHTAIESFVRKFGKIVVVKGKGEAEIQAELVALDPTSDIALVRFGGVDPYSDSRTKAPFQPVQFARNECAKLTNVVGAGYPDSMSDDFGRSTWGQIQECHLVPVTYDVGRPWTSAMVYRTNADFEAGMSGGPVIGETGRLLGMVAGATANGKRSFLVPVASIRAFLRRLGIEVESDQ